MTTTINASTSAGLVQTADTSGALALQTANTTAISINSSQQVSFTNPLASVSLTTPTMTSPTISSGPLTIGTTALGAGNSSIMKNRIINGAMVIDQRNAGASVATTSAGSGSTFSVDRFPLFCTQNAKFTAQQNAGSVTPPVGFVNYLGITSTSAYSITSGDYFAVGQSIEGFNTADLNWGTANAKTITISFWVYSSLTGTFGAVLQNQGNSRTYPFTYTISAANTWEQKSVTVAGDTTGTWNTTTGIGIRVLFGLGVGSTYSGTAGSWSSSLYLGATGATSVVGTSGATFYITGVQLEVGSSATGFEYVNYQTSLANCQRYFTRYDYVTVGPVNIAYVDGSTIARTVVLLPIMRSAPTVNSSAGSTFEFNNGSINTSFTGTSFNGIGTSSCYMQLTGGSGMTIGQAGILRAVTSANITASAEL